VEFLQTAVPDVQQYMQLMPSMETLHQEYRLDAEVIFALWRPVLQALPRASAAATAAADGEDEEMEEGEAPGAHGFTPPTTTRIPCSMYRRRVWCCPRKTERITLVFEPE
jgi:hypothetical protein